MKQIPEPKIQPSIPSPLWRQVKTLEDSAGDTQRVLNEIINTLVANFGKGNGRNPELIFIEDRPITMLIKVLEYYVKTSQPVAGEGAEEVSRNLLIGFMAHKNGVTGVSWLEKINEYLRTDKAKQLISQLFKPESKTESADYLELHKEFLKQQIELEELKKVKTESAGHWKDALKSWIAKHHPSWSFITESAVSAEEVGIISIHDLAYAHCEKNLQPSWDNPISEEHRDIWHEWRNECIDLFTAGYNSGRAYASSKEKEVELLKEQINEWAEENRQVDLENAKQEKEIRLQKVEIENLEFRLKCANEVIDEKDREIAELKYALKVISDSDKKAEGLSGVKTAILQSENAELKAELQRVKGCTIKAGERIREEMGKECKFCGDTIEKHEKRCKGFGA